MGKNHVVLSVTVAYSANALGCDAIGDGFAPDTGGYSEINFSGRYVSSTEGRETVCVALQEFTVVCNVRRDNR
jgi:hypothetical protein